MSSIAFPQNGTKHHFDSTKIIRVLFINSFIILYAILFFFKLNTRFYYANIISFVTALFFLLLADAFLLYYDQKLYYSRKLIQSYEKNLPIYETLISEIRTSQHNYSNQIQTLRQLPEEIPASEIRKFFQKGYSTKKSDIKEDGIAHGIGLYYLLNAIQKYHGTISANCISFEGECWMNIELII